MRRTGSWPKAALAAGGVFMLCLVGGAMLLFALDAQRVLFDVRGIPVRELAEALGWGPLIGAWAGVWALPALAAALAVYERVRRPPRPRSTEPAGIGGAEIAAVWHRFRRWLLSANEGSPWKLVLLSFFVFYGVLFAERLLLWEPWSPFRNAWRALEKAVLPPIGLFAGLTVLSLLDLLPPFAVAILMFSKLYRRRLRDTEYLRCLKCGYILKGLSEPRCPECGERI
jgi:hypothetical protein